MIVSAAELHNQERDRRKAERDAERAAMDVAAAQRLVEEKAASEERGKREALKKQRDEERKQEEEEAKAKEAAAAAETQQTSRPAEGATGEKLNHAAGEQMEIDGTDPTYEMHSGGLSEGKEDEAEAEADQWRRSEPSLPS